MKQRFKGRRVLITGGAGGIGRATARAFLAAGARVAITDLRQGRRLEGALFLQAEATKEDEAAAVVEAVARRFGRIDILFNNCGVGANLDAALGRKAVCRTALDLREEDLDRVMGVNFRSALWFVRHAIRHMPTSDASCIVTSGSIWAKGKLHGALPYAASKAALAVATMNWARQFAPIRSVSIALGGIDTPMLRSNPNGTREVARETLLKRAGRPEEVAETVLYVSSCRYLTATEIVLDGGSSNR